MPHHVYCIAEIGTTHQGNLNKAKELVMAAKEAGADAAKFQIVFADEILPETAGHINVNNKTVDIFTALQETEQNIAFYQELHAYCQAVGIEFLATPFGLRSASLLKQLHVQKVKIASPELNHFPLLQELATWDIDQWILSSGVSLLGDIEQALCYFDDRAKVSLLHCVTAYPAKEEEYNLRLIPALKKMFGVAVGVSDHSLNPFVIPVLSTLLGATVLEKHITLSKQDQGLDDAMALAPQDFSAMVKEVRSASHWLQQYPEKNTANIDALVHAYVQSHANSHTSSLFDGYDIAAILGDGQKVLSPSEQEFYATTNRSLHALCDIDQGQLFSPKNVAVLRSEKGTTVGISPALYDTIIGAPCQSFLPKGEGLEWHHIIKKDK